MSDPGSPRHPSRLLPGEALRHARHPRRLNVAAVVALGVPFVVGVGMASAGLVPGVAPAVERIGVEVAAGGVPVPGVRDGEASRAAERAGVGGPAGAPQPAAALPTWTGGAEVGEGPEPTRTRAPSVTAATPTGTPTATAPVPSGVPSATGPGETTAASPEPTATPNTSATTGTASSTTAATTPPAPPLTDAQQQLVALVDARRAAAACPPLTVDARLSASAGGHAADMVARGFFDHTSPDGSTPTSRAQAAGWNAAVTENIATGFTDPQAVVTAWMDTPLYREHILTCSSTFVGVGFHPGALPGFAGGTWVAVFAPLP